MLTLPWSIFFRSDRSFFFSFIVALILNPPSFRAKANVKRNPRALRDFSSTHLETSAAANERLRANKHDKQDDDQHCAGGISVTGYEPEKFRIGGEQPFGHGESLVVQVRIVYYDGTCVQTNTGTSVRGKRYSYT